MWTHTHTHIWSGFGGLCVPAGRHHKWVGSGGSCERQPDAGGSIRVPPPNALSGRTVVELVTAERSNAHNVHVLLCMFELQMPVLVVITEAASFE